MGKVTDFRIELDGNEFLEPVNWVGMSEVFIYGQNSNQPAIESQDFTFTGNAANYIYGRFKSGQILNPIVVNGYLRQQDKEEVIINDYILDMTGGVSFIDNSFNGEIQPNEIDCQIRKKDGADYFLTELKGVTWSLLEAKGAFSENDYTTIPTKVSPIYNFGDIANTILTIYTLSVQIVNIVQQAQKDIADASQRIAGLDPASSAAAIVYIIAITALKIIAYLAIVLLSVKVALGILNSFSFIKLKNKGITLRKGMEIICSFLGYEFVSSITALDKVCYMPSGGSSNGKNIIKDELPNWYANTKGVPNPVDYGYNAADFVEICKSEYNARIDVIDGKVYLRNKFDPSLYKQGTFQKTIPAQYKTISPNITEIPHTRFFSYSTDESDGYTREYQEGRLYEVKNISKGLPFKEGEYYESPLCLAHRKDSLNPLEKAVKSVLSVADQLNKILGKKTNLAQKFKTNNTGCIKVTQNNFSKPKLVPIINGVVPSNHLEIVSAKAKYSYYEGDSIATGTGQKLILEGVEMPMSLEERNKIVDNGNFLDDYWGECRIRKLEYTYGSDIGTFDIEVNNNYIADNTYTEEIYDGQ